MISCFHNKSFPTSLLLVALLILSGCNQRANIYFEKRLKLPGLATYDQKAKLAGYVVPTKNQLEWQQMELIAFAYFGINTFTGNEWGAGDDSPELFNPTDFDAEQWVVTLKNAGFKMIILTAKHHDGFCLWPTSTTDYSVVSSPWHNGNGDVVREVKNACDKHNMKFGVYLSPLDHNAESYGNSVAYNELYAKQLAELLSNYGEIHEVWFDGANGEGTNGRVQQYDWRRFYNVIDSLQPNTIKAIMGNDVRWVGNEDGLGRQTEWSVTPLQPGINETFIAENARLNISPTSYDLGSRNLINDSKTLYWYPSEVDVSIRPGWFYKEKEDKDVKSLAELIDIYYRSVGMNSVLILNVPPDTRGRINTVDSTRVTEFGNYIRTVFDNELIENGDAEWKAKAGTSKEYVITTGEGFNTLMIQEDITKGQRVERFSVEAFVSGEWVPLTEGTTIGYKRLLRFDNCKASRIRINIDETRDIANIKKVGAYYANPLVESTTANENNDSSENIE
jgi:alpha-L-fucosidase